MIAWCWFFPLPCFSTIGAKSLTGKTFNTGISSERSLFAFRTLMLIPTRLFPCCSNFFHRVSYLFDRV
ncbi:unnamed protein product, partial [Arabidopsis halleri]